MLRPLPTKREIPTDSDRVVRQFRSGQNQAVRTPRDMELPGDEASRRRQGDALVIVRNRGRNLLGTLRTLKPLRENTGSVADQTA